MSSSDKYLQLVTGILTSIAQDEHGALNKAALMLADQIAADRMIHVFGTGGHSIMGAMELFYRAGNFANINPLFPAGLSLVDSHPNIERTPGIASSVLKFYQVAKDDVLVIINVNGINPLTIETALEAHKMGAKVIAITSPAFSTQVPPNISARHVSNQNLHDLADVVLDVYVPAGDAILEIPGLAQKVGPSSTYAVCFAANLMCIKACEILLQRGIQPPVWTSVNIKGGEEANKAHMKKYLGKIHHLYPMF